MLGALGALIRKDERTLFNKHSDGLYVSAPKLSQGMEEEFTEELGYEIQNKLLERWPFEATDKSWNKLKILFKHSRLRILYTSEESHEWVLYVETDQNEKIDINDDDNNSNNIMDDMTNYGFADDINSISNPLMLSQDQDMQCLGGVYQKFNFEFGDGKFHDIVSMGSTKNIGWNVLDSSSFDPFVLSNVGNILNLQRKINNNYNVSMPAEIWHIIMGFAIDCFEPISQMMEVDIVLRDVRRWTQNLYLSENLRRRDEFGDSGIRKLGQLFIEIGGMIDSEYIKYRKQFSLRKKFVRFMKYKFGKITNDTSQKLKNLKNNEHNDENDKGKKSEKRKRKKKEEDEKERENTKQSKYCKHCKKRKHEKRKNAKIINEIQHIRCHSIDGSHVSNDHSTPHTLTPHKSADI